MPETSSAWLECNICLEAAREPVVTLCGHLYCWPCIYEWLHVQSAALPSDEPPTCPVCKAHASHTAMIPLLSRQSAKFQTPSSVPPRPAALPPAGPATGQRLPYRNPYQSREIVADEDQESSLAGVFGGLVYAHLSAYGHAGRRRVRRQDVHAHKSLNRVSIFLFCCLLLCLLVF